MTRLLTTAAAIATFGLGLTLGALPAAAQEDSLGAGDEKVNQLIIYGDDPCPASASGEITVCARKAEAERYRIPEPLRGIDSPKSDAWTNKVQAYETVGAFGNMSCSPVGAGGASGCTQKLIDRAYAEKKNGSDVKFSELIQAEREKRLSTIDADAAEQQKRVEEAEKAYFDQRQRQEAEEDAKAAAAAGQPAAPLPKPKP
ncbi:hypothetical protein ACLIMP_02935 [Novosphingobium aerophilum]|uniref:hypothetical protein n=1 Tax=Novosphingobium TaxID=165696 RepID=UPI001053F939|nr:MULTISPECIES: hypothetical protein [unclassified Novosphingobium]MPS67493.1 hypothetical protein [Novosphingobium sp.]TCM43029.1 hypothetical protein EDF59_101130 [Novosphingobium sp. ST904]WRT93239.1 hypothetical protein U9J33_01615 [Novosphingobium sp. RL4]